MNSDKKSTSVRDSAFQFNRQGAHVPGIKSVVAQLKAGVPVPTIKRPVAPPVYRPQETPKVLQTKRSSSPKSLSAQPPAPVAPSVYRPEAKKVVQRKTLSPSRTSPTPPPAYRPQQTRVAQSKTAAGAPLHSLPVYRPQSNVNAPRNLPVQLKSKLPGPTAAPGRANLHPRRGGAVIQRVIVIGGKEYSLTNKRELEETFPEQERERMLTGGMKDVPGRPTTLDQALGERRRFYLMRDELPKFGVYFDATADPFVEKLEEGGSTREVGQRPELITRPEAGVEEIRIDSLISCVGIIIEAQREGRIQAAAAAHFVTPTCVADGKLKDTGVQLIESQIQMVGPYGALNVILVHSTDDLQNSLEAVKLISAFMQSKGLTTIKTRQGLYSLKYRLKADGSSTLSAG
jgi:hypothetical protein